MTTDSSTPNHRLAASDLAARMRNHARDNYMFLTGIMKSVTVANAAYVLGLLMASEVPVLQWLPFWLGSFALLVVSLMGVFAATLVVGFDPDWKDNVIPLSQTILEFLLFSVLMPSGERMPSVINWYLLVGLQAGAGALANLNVGQKVRVSEYGEELGAIANQFRKSMTSRGHRAAGACVFWIGVWVAIRFAILPTFPAFAGFQGLVAIWVVPMAIVIVRQMESDRRTIVSLVHAQLGEPPR